MVQRHSLRSRLRLPAGLLAALLAGAAVTAVTVRPATAAPRDLTKLVPNALDIVKSPERYAGTGRRHLVVRPGRVALLRGATLVDSVALPAGPVSLAEVEAAVNAAGDPGWIEEQEPGVFLLRAALVSGPGTVLTFEAPAVREVRLLDHPELYISAVGATGRFTGVTVTSWDPAAGRPVTDASRPRPFVQYANGSTLDIVRSTFAYLGSDRASAYGINWHQSTGKAVGSVFHHNFFGGYTYAADGVVFSDNVYRDNAVYGLDPHTASKRLVVTGNRAFRNKVHGIVFSIDVSDSLIRGNYAHDNGANGIVMDDRSDRNVITGNLVERNKGDGIVLLGSSRNRVEGNTVRANRTGLRVNLRSVGNRLVRNSVTGNAVGAEVYGGANATELEGNRFEGSARTGMTLEAPGTRSLADQVSGSPTGVELRGVARVERTSVTGADKGIVVAQHGIAEITGVRVQARAAGVEIRPGGRAEVVDSAITAAAPLAGAEPRSATGNTLTTPGGAGRPLLAMVGLGFLLLAVALFALQRLRTGRRVEAYWVGQARADRHSRRARQAALARAQRAAGPAGPAAVSATRAAARRARRRRARPVRVALAIGGLLGAVAASAAAAAAVSGVARGELVQLVVRQAGPAGQVQIRSGDLDLPELADALAARGQASSLTRSGRTWLLNRTVILLPGARLTVSGAELRLASGDGTAVGLEARGGTLVVERSTVTSWDRRRQRPDGDLRDGRAWVLAAGGRMELRDSRMLQLGYDLAERTGVSWLAGAGGTVEGSTLRGNWIGLTADGADRLLVRASIMEHARRSGAEPGGSGLVLEDNVFRHNGQHGISLLAGRAPGAVVTGNASFANRGHGIALGAGAGEAAVTGNEVHDNRRSGIDVEGAAGVRLAGNVVYGNQFGLSVHDRASGVGIEGNRVTANRVDGVRVSTAAVVTVMRNNLLDHNLRAGAYLGSGSASIGPGNRMTDNDTGMWLAGDAGRADIVGNRIADNVLDGVHMGTAPRAAVLRGNVIDGNRKAAFSVAAAGAAKAFTAGNQIGKHPAVERVRVAEQEGGLRKGAVGQALHR